MKRYVLAGVTEDDLVELVRHITKAGRALEESWALHDGTTKADLVIVDLEHFAGLTPCRKRPRIILHAPSGRAMALGRPGSILRPLPESRGVGAREPRLPDRGPRPQLELHCTGMCGHQHAGPRLLPPRDDFGRGQAPAIAVPG